MSQIEANSDEVICPACAHQFRAIPVNVQALLLAAGHEPPRSFKRGEAVAAPCGRAVVCMVEPGRERNIGVQYEADTPGLLTWYAAAELAPWPQQSPTPSLGPGLRAAVEALRRIGEGNFGFDDGHHNGRFLLRDDVLRLIDEGYDRYDLGFAHGIRFADESLTGKDIGASPAPSVEPAAWMRADGMKAMPADEKAAWIEAGSPSLVEDYTIPLYAAPTAAVHEPEARDQVHPAQAIERGKESVTVSVDRMDESHRVTYWVQLRRGDEVQSIRQYDEHRKNRADYEADSLRFLFGQGPRPFILDYPEADPASIPQATARPDAQEPGRGQT